MILNGYIPVASYEDFLAINALTEDYRFAGSTAYSLVTDAALDKKYVIVQDIDLSRYSGSTALINKTFTGELNGLNYTLSNLTINNEAGLFQLLNGANIQDLTLYNFNFTTSDSQRGILARGVEGTTIIQSVHIVASSLNSSKFNAGGFFGQVGSPNVNSNLILDDVSINGDIIGTDNNIGGIIGAAFSNNGHYTTITMVSIKTNVTVSGVDKVGGLIGEVSQSGGQPMNLSIDSVDANVRVTGSGINIGGVIGLIDESNYVSIKNVNLEGTVIGHNQYIGGIVGDLKDLSKGVFTNIDNRASVNEQNSTTTITYIGGIFGRVENSQITISSITQLSTVETSSSTRRYRGGIIGWVRGTTTKIQGESIIALSEETGISQSDYIGTVISGISSETVNLTSINDGISTTGQYYVGRDLVSHTNSDGEISK